jgi:hypothetical protein
MYSLCGGKNAGQIVWLPEPSFVHEVIAPYSVIANLPAYITTAALLYHSVPRLSIYMYFYIIITLKPETNLYDA